MSNQAPNEKKKQNGLQGRIGTRTRSKLWIMAGIILAFSGAGWYKYFHGTGWTDQINPILWFHRYRGDDLYISGEARLLRGNRALHEVALTFDDGPHPGSREEILKTLKRFGAHATFFDVGINMEREPDLVQKTLLEGNEIGNHSMHHNRLDSLASGECHREINDTDITFYRIMKRHLSLLRPPGNRYNSEVLSEIQRLGYITVGYTTASKDFQDEEPGVIAARTLGNQTENGSILLLHDYPETAVALPLILETLRNRGFRCVTISEMIAHLPNLPRDEAHNFIKKHAD